MPPDLPGDRRRAVRLAHTRRTSEHTSPQADARRRPSPPRSPDETEFSPDRQPAASSSTRRTSDGSIPASRRSRFDSPCSTSTIPSRRPAGSIAGRRRRSASRRACSKACLTRGATPIPPARSDVHRRLGRRHGCHGWCTGRRRRSMASFPKVRRTADRTSSRSTPSVFNNSASRGGGPSRKFSSEALTWSASRGSSAARGHGFGKELAVSDQREKQMLGAT